eukprot:s2688_g9.t1
MPRSRAVLGGLGLLLSSTLRRPASVFSAGTQTPSAGSRQIQHGGRASFVSALPKLTHHEAVARKHLVKAGDAQSAEASSEPRLASAELVGGACFWGLMYWLFFKAVAHITKLVEAIPELEIGSFLALSLIPLFMVRSFSCIGPLAELQGARCHGSRSNEHL